MAYLSVENLKKAFGGTRVLRDVSFQLPEGETLSVIGSSGSGITSVTTMHSAPIQNRKKAQVRGIQPAAGIKTVFLFLFAAFIVPSFGAIRLYASASRVYVHVRRG